MSANARIASVDNETLRKNFDVPQRNNASVKSDVRLPVPLHVLFGGYGEGVPSFNEVDYFGRVEAKS